MRRRSLFDRLASPRLAALLIGVLLLGCVVSFVVPQRNKPQLTLYEEWSDRNPGIAKVASLLELDDVFASPMMAAVYGLLAVNLTACTLGRVSRRRKRKMVIPRPPERAHVITISGTSTADDAVEAAVARAPLGWRKLGAADARSGYVIDGGWLGFVGSVVMHVGLVLLLVGGLASALTRFSGEMALTVGEMVPDRAESYVSAPKEPPLGTGYLDGSVGLRALRFEYEEGQVTSVEALMEFSEGQGSRTEKVRINEPARWRGKSFLLYSGGHAAPIRVVGADGEALLEGVVRLGDRVDGGYSDEIELPDSRRLRIQTVADIADPKDADTEVMALRDPRVLVTSVGEDASATALAAGEVAQVGDLRVTAGAVTLWTTLLVRSDGGIPVTYFSFALIILGVAMRLLFPSQSVAVRIDDAEDGVRVVSVWARRGSPAEERVAARLEASLRIEEST